jgi:hypothetical protein
MAPPTHFLSQAQIDRITAITNERGAVFSFPVSGAPPIPAHYSFVSTELGNQLSISARRETTGTVITEQKSAKAPLPPPGEELDALINSVVDLIERQISLKPSG